MDELLAEGERRVQALLALFPQCTNGRAEYDALSPRIRDLKIWIDDQPDPSPARDQYKLLFAHVQVCLDIWVNINAGRSISTTMDEHYGAGLAAKLGQMPAAPPTPMTPRRSTQPYSGEKDELGKSNQQIRLGNMRELARMWRDALGVNHLQALCAFGLGEAWVRELKVSAGVEQLRYNRPKQVFV
jgi:hypothetical protein